MKINLYSNGSYTVDHGWKAASYPPYIPEAIDTWEDVGREVEDAERHPFLWKTDKGKVMTVRDMATPHLINAINMIWGNVFGTREDRPEIAEYWSSAYVDRAALEFSKELQRRLEDPYAY